MKARIARPPRDYRSLGIMLDRVRKPTGAARHQLTVSVWWLDMGVAW